MDKELIIALLLGVGLSASSGFRIFIPLLVASVANYFDFLNLGDGFTWMGTLPAIISFATASVVEIAAYYIPVVDNVLDTIASPLALIAGALLTTSVLPIESEWIKWALGIIIGGGSAGVVQSGTVLSRLFSSQATLTAGNPVVATGENVGAITGSIFSLFFPVVIGVIFLIAIIWILSKYGSTIFKKNTEPN